MENIQRPTVLSIAGFDPSAGAGILADIKAFECIGVYGIGVITAYTLQTENIFQGLKWRTLSSIIEEILFVNQHYSIKYAKIGIIKNIDMLREIIYVLNKKNIRIIWDPILKSSTSKKIFDRKNLSQIKDIIKNIYCITPNVEEALILSSKTTVIEAGSYLSNFTNVIIKGGHNEQDLGTDLLFLYQKKDFIKISPQTNLFIYPKHGSGCVFASALTAYSALENSLNQSANFAKIYTEKFLASNKTLLGYHSRN